MIAWATVFVHALRICDRIIERVIVFVIIKTILQHSFVGDI